MPSSAHEWWRAERTLLARWRNLCQMLVDRGIDVPDAAVDAVPDPTTAECALVIGNTLAVLAPTARSLDKEGYQQALELRAAKQVATVLVVTLQAASPHTASAIAKAAGKVEHHTWTFFDFCVVRHEAVPRHERFPGTWEAFVRTFRLQASSAEQPPERVLPHILASDPVVRYHAWPVGTIVLIQRPQRGERPAELAARVVVPT
jgi:DNA-directed RNA polymerase subunit H (RpoH/RPB5)